MSEKTNKAELTRRLLALVGETAMLALKSPEAEREAFLVMRRQDYIDDAMRFGVTEEEAEDWADMMDEWVRDLIGLVERTGGTDGGEA